jgi:ABC-type Fe3+/spermidine/putrescine transport system ATPase subunit
MSDRVVVMNEGRIQQIADPHTIYTRPVNAFVAKFIGVANLMDGIVLGRSGKSWELEIALGAKDRTPLRLRADGDDGFAPGCPAVLCVRPEDIRLHTARPDDAAGHNIIEAEVIDTVYLGTFLECHVRVGPYEMCVQTDHLKPLAPGEKVFLTFQPDHGLCLAG